MSKHTPGPWLVLHLDSGAIAIDQDKEPYGLSELARLEVVNYRIQGREYREQFEANARLIAAAPELLEVLKECKGYLLTYGNKDYPHARLAQLAAVENAIAKAEGRDE